MTTSLSRLLAILLAALPATRSARLPSGLANPMPGGTFAGYDGDTGLDLAGPPSPVYALAAGTLDYSERGHTLWTGRGDTPNCVRIALDQPIAWRGRRITHLYYAHLSELVYAQIESDPNKVHVEAGDWLGTSGFGRGSPHLHLGVLLDGNVAQDTWDDLLREDEIRALLGGQRSGQRLPSR